MKLPDWFVCLGEALMESEAPARCRTTTLTNAEREAVLYCVSCAQDYRDTLDVCEQPEKYDRATQMIEAAMRLAIPNVGPAPVEGQRTASVTDVGGAGPTLAETQIYWLAYAAEKLHNPHSKSCRSSQCSMSIIDLLRSIGRWSDAGFVERKAAK